MSGQERQPNCENCDFYKRNFESGRSCTRYDFVMPAIGWPMACADWRRHDEPDAQIQRLPPGALYYYSTVSGEFVSLSLGEFPSIQTPLISANLRQDNELGWVLYPRRANQLLPRAGSEFVLLVNGNQYAFAPAQVERPMSQTASPTGEGWEPSSRAHSILMLQSLDDPDLLYHWANTYMDFDSYIADSLVPSLFTFVEIVEPGQVYALHPDLLMYDRYRHVQAPAPSAAEQPGFLRRFLRRLFGR